MACSFLCGVTGGSNCSGSGKLCQNKAEPEKKIPHARCSQNLRLEDPRRRQTCGRRRWNSIWKCGEEVFRLHSGLRWRHNVKARKQGSVFSKRVWVALTALKKEKPWEMNCGGAMQLHKVGMWCSSWGPTQIGAWRRSTGFPRRQCHLYYCCFHRDDTAYWTDFSRTAFWVDTDSYLFLPSSKNKCRPRRVNI